MYWLLYYDIIENWWNCIWILYFKAGIQTTFHQRSSSQTKMHGPNIHRYPCNKRNLDANVHLQTSHYKVCTTTDKCIALISAILHHIQRRSTTCMHWNWIEILPILFMYKLISCKWWEEIHSGTSPQELQELLVFETCILGLKLTSIPTIIPRFLHCNVEVNQLLPSTSLYCLELFFGESHACNFNDYFIDSHPHHPSSIHQAQCWNQLTADSPSASL